jgi:ABC-type polysaccharide/polyol phosphate transport system ATPase subunit
MNSVIEFHRVSKQYRLGELRGGLRDALAAQGRRLLGGDRETRQTLWALRDVSFQVPRGEALGIVGPNGAGKTTIMKLLSRITRPTTGSVRSKGRISSLIELGAGFHPDLTGRENIYLNGTILGMSRRRIAERFDEIVEFSGLERFLDTPVKRYSSGMYARLGFSVAAHTGAEILLVDEALSVGDLGFQAKCTQRMGELVDQGTTVLFISHSLYTVSSFCQQAMLVHRGWIQSLGKPQDIVAAYQTLMREQADIERAKSESGPDALGMGDRARLVEAELLAGDGTACARFETGQSLTLKVRGYAPQTLRNAVLRFSIFSSDGVRCFTAHNRQEGVHFPDLTGSFEIRVLFPELMLMPDSYSVTVWLLEEHGIGAHDWKASWVSFQVYHPSHDCAEGGVAYLPHQWQVSEDTAENILSGEPSEGSHPVSAVRVRVTTKP